jgi:multicomponent Na+:H+ antiporter subunit E
MSRERAHVPAPSLSSPTRAAVTRGAGFLALWMILMQSVAFKDLAMGAFATACATWASVYLLPPAGGRLRFTVLLGFLPHFLWQSVVAGVDVARLAFSPRMPMQPGFVQCPLNFPPGLTRNTFAMITSLLPGSVPSGESDGILIYHALDTTQPVAEQLRDEERLLARGLVAGVRND